MKQVAHALASRARIGDWSERGKAHGNGGANVPEAHDTEAATANFARERAFSLHPPAASHESVGGRNVAKQTYDESDREIGDVFGQNARRRSDAHSVAACIGQIDPVDADAIDGNDAERGQPRHELVAAPDVTAGNHRPDLRGLPLKPGRLLRNAEFEPANELETLPQSRLEIGGKRAELQRRRARFVHG